MPSAFGIIPNYATKGTNGLKATAETGNSMKRPCRTMQEIHLFLSTCKARTNNKKTDNES